MKIGIVGAGASGTFAAITAAKEGAQVTLIERKDRICKKILATGNGKCNFTNKEMCEFDYRSQKEDVFFDYIGQFDEKAAISSFHKMGMLTKDRNGYCYPRSEQASTVSDVLRFQAQQSGVQILTEVYPVRIEKKKNCFEVCLNTKERLFFDRIILACGSYAGEKAGDEYNGYSYAKSFGHSLVPVVPALVQVRAKNGALFRSISGVRCDAKLSLYIDQKPVTKESGELQLTDYGISGIPVFQLSRYVSYGIYEKKQVYVMIDLFPEQDLEALSAFLKEKWKRSDKNISAEEFFQGFLNKKLNLMFLKNTGIKASMSLKELSFSKLLEVIKAMKNWKIDVEGTNPFVNAQVCAGGVSMEEITLQMESKIVPGLYFTGELLDVDGRCGGYNLQWAWTSGYLAGKNAAAQDRTYSKKKGK